MSQNPESEVPDGAAVFPLIPPELGVNPVLLATLHAVVFLIGSDEKVVEPAAGEEAIQYLITYLQRLSGRELERVREDLDCLVSFAKHEGWPEHDQEFLQSFLAEFGIGIQTEE
jgi:hypothetical protein